ncbi:hypothetical protein ABFY27_02545 [Akkermansia massiliensis]
MSEELVEEFVTVESIFVRERNCLVLKAKFSPCSRTTTSISCSTACGTRSLTTAS